MLFKRYSCICMYIYTYAADMHMCSRSFVIQINSFVLLVIYIYVLPFIYVCIINS